jgi:hypothetical protein
MEKKLVLTYDNSAMTDGVGAQLQRIYGIYAISRLLGATYLHSPLSRVDYQGLAALERNVADPGFHHAFNELFRIESDILPSNELYEVRLREISIDAVNQLVATYDKHETGGRPALVRLMFPYGIADRFPDCYEVCKEVSPFSPTRQEGRVLRVAVHVRRGEQIVLNSERMLPNSYFIQVARNVADALRALNVDFQIELYTEVPDKAFVVQPEDHGILNRISAPFELHPDMSRIDEFSVLPNLVHRINGTVIDCIRGLATADVLVMSRSSFSYLGGILNTEGIVLYHPFWHRAPSSWLTVDPDGQFAQQEFSRAVQRLSREFRAS